MSRCFMPLNLPVDTDDIREMEAAASNAIYFLTHAENVFSMLGTAFSNGTLAGDDPGVIGLMEMLERGYRHVAENEGETLLKIGMAFQVCIRADEVREGKHDNLS